MDKQYKSVKPEQRKKNLWIWISIGLVVLILIIGIFYLSPLFKQQEKTTEASIETEAPETFIFSNIEGELDLDDIENAIKGALNQ